MKDLPDYRKTIVPVSYFENNIDFAKMVSLAYDDAKEKNCSWYGPKIPFYISSPKLIDNGKAAQMVLRNKKQKYQKTTHGGKRKGAGGPKKEPTKVMRIPVSKIPAVKELIRNEK